MKSKWLFSALLSCWALSLTGAPVPADNPFLLEWHTPFGTPPFADIQSFHFLPALNEGMSRQKKEVAAIVSDAAAPTFANTIEALEKSGELLTRVSNVFYFLLGANTSDELQKISQAASPLLSKHYDDINLNEKLFQRIKDLYDRKSLLGLTPEQARLLDRYYKDFIKRGANLDAGQKEKLAKINEELSALTLSFGENVLKDTAAFELVVSDEKDLAGLPESAVAAARDEAGKKGYANKWLFTLQAPSYRALIRYCDNRDLREKIYRASLAVANHGNRYDNQANVSRIIALRFQKARLLGYPTFADYVLDDYMAQNPKRVYEFLLGLWQPILKKVGQEIGEMQKLAADSRGPEKLAPWDISYYAQKLKKAKYSLDDEMIRPYFKIEDVFTGLFGLVNRLYGLQFSEKKDIPVYQGDVKVFEVKEKDGRHLGILYADYFPRDNKQAGAWCGVIRDQNRLGEKPVTPITYNIGNVTKPTAGKPSLLSLGEVETIYHEFGHALHNLFSNVTYPRLTAGNVAWDFVELPSQTLEDFASDPEVLKMIARHYQTGAAMPDDLIAKIKNAKLFNIGIATVNSLLYPALVDMDLHSGNEAAAADIGAFEANAARKYGLPVELGSPYPSTQNGHIFGGGYAAGYYSYIWAAVLDSDAFAAFKEQGLFDAGLAASFRANILEKGNSEDPLELYKRFRGREPRVDALLKKLGIN
jgi:peptidyl-dipeptidase Dcp